jgi:hypothetical protein
MTRIALDRFLKGPLSYFAEDDHRGDYRQAYWVPYTLKGPSGEDVLQGQDVAQFNALTIVANYPVGKLISAQAMINAGWRITFHEWSADLVSRSTYWT